MEPERGTPQGSGLSPLLGNLYLHHTLDVWFEREVKPRLGGEAVLVRYCDDFVIGFERREDAQRVAEVLGKRMERFGLRLHPEKTRLIAFERPEAGQRSGKGPGTFDFLGFTMYWRRTRNGSGVSGCAVAASVRVSRGSGSADSWNASRFPGRGLSCGYGGRSHEAHQRRSRMVEISLSGSGEGLG